MADTQRSGPLGKDIDQVIATLKKRSYLLKYRRRGKPKFCTFRLSNIESLLVWYSGNAEKQIKLSHVLKIIPGKRIAIFQRHPQPEKEYQSFSLICNDRNLDLDPGDKVGGNFDSVSQNRLGKAFADIISYTTTTKNLNHAMPVVNPSPPSSASPVFADNPNGRGSTFDAICSSSLDSCQDDFDALGDVFIWGEGIGNGILGGGGVDKVENSLDLKIDALLPEALESSVALDVENIAFGRRHVVLVTKHGGIFTWGEEAGGRRQEVGSVMM